ncbi:hypothetical protein EBL89_05315 [Cereibacter sphaeroides]|nr:hypothetical protein EBL89_05315 [Cereibacter sphaeroides]AZB59028.1 hypothetical protein EBL88_05350 [Cereibacter sphaeroides]
MAFEGREALQLLLYLDYLLLNTFLVVCLALHVIAVRLLNGVFVVALKPVMDCGLGSAPAFFSRSDDECGVFKPVVVNPLPPFEAHQLDSVEERVRLMFDDLYKFFKALTIYILEICESIQKN